MDYLLVCLICWKAGSVRKCFNAEPFKQILNFNFYLISKVSAETIPDKKIYKICQGVEFKEISTQSRIDYKYNVNQVWFIKRKAYGKFFWIF